MLTLYPAIQPYAVHQLAVDFPHNLYVEVCGNPKGIPVVVLHGGPGAGNSEDNRRFFDPERFRIILFDQRGAGRSTPYASLEGNTTQALVQDMEAIRLHFGIDRWVLFGGSWGSTLALVYAETYPDRVLNMVLRGIFLCRKKDLDWFYQKDGASRLFPEHWDNFVGHLLPEERLEVFKAYLRRLTGADEVARMSAAKVWAEWEGMCSTLQPSNSVLNHFTHPHVAVSLACIECHYFLNNTFLEEDQIIKNADQLLGIPGTLIHGRYDVVCPLDNAYDLHKAWPESELQIIPASGHSAFEPGITNAIIMVTNRIARELSKT